VRWKEPAARGQTTGSSPGCARPEDAGAEPTANPAIEHAQQAGRFAALAIGSLDRDAPTVPEAITDCLAPLLFTCVFADAATRSRPGA
jgi:hypothetical protein